MTRSRRVVLVGSLVATAGLTLVLGVTDPAPPASYPTRFFVWNLVLAWIPVCFAAGVALVRQRIWLIPLGLGWLAFLPNAPYLMTDLVHLGSRVKLWRHVMQYGVAAWTGILLGAVSMHLVHRRISHEFGAVTGWIAVVISVGLCAIGVVIGRFSAVELLGSADASGRGRGDNARLGAFAACLRAANRCSARGWSLVRAGIPHTVVPLALP